METFNVVAGPGTVPSRAVAAGGLEMALERAVAQLEELERDYDRARALVEAALHPQPWKEWKLAQLACGHAREREPLIQLIATLHHRIVSARFLREAAGEVVASEGAPVPEGRRVPGFVTD